MIYHVFIYKFFSFIYCNLSYQEPYKITWTTQKWQITLVVTYGSLYLSMMYLLIVMFCLVCVGFVFVFCYYDNEMIWCTCAYGANDK